MPCAGAGFDVISVGETNAGASAPVVLDMAGRDGRVLITFDKDFGELAFRRVPGEVSGIILLRVRPQSPQLVADTPRELLDSGRAWEGFFSVVGETRIRMVPLPRR